MSILVGTSQPAGTGLSKYKQHCGMSRPGVSSVINSHDHSRSHSAISCTKWQPAFRPGMGLPPFSVLFMACQPGIRLNNDFVPLLYRDGTSDAAVNGPTEGAAVDGDTDMKDADDAV